ncbi:MAG: hypothetical protein ACRDHF_00215, partial [Tepidiformaceae bacterium]
MVQWRFADSAEDGEAWLRRPSLLQVHVDYDSKREPGTWRRSKANVEYDLERSVEATEWSGPGRAPVGGGRTAENST